MHVNSGRASKFGRSRSTSAQVGPIPVTSRQTLPNSGASSVRFARTCRGATRCSACLGGSSTGCRLRGSSMVGPRLHQHETRPGMGVQGSYSDDIPLSRRTESRPRKSASPPESEKRKIAQIRAALQRPFTSEFPAVQNPVSDEHSPFSTSSRLSLD